MEVIRVKPMYLLASSLQHFPQLLVKIVRGELDSPATGADRSETRVVRRGVLGNLLFSLNRHCRNGDVGFKVGVNIRFVDRILREKKHVLGVKGMITDV